MALSAAGAASRSIEPMSVIAELAKHSGMNLLPFGESTRDVAPSNMLELSDVVNETAWPISRWKLKSPPSCRKWTAMKTCSCHSPSTGST